MIEIEYKFKSNSGVNVTVIKKCNNWGSHIVQLRKVDDNGKVLREGAKVVSAEDIKSKNIDFEEDYIKLYADLMREESKKRKLNG